MIVICPSCAKSNYCPEMAAGLTLCCRRCRTQITLPESPGARPPRWYATPYWIGVVCAELLAAAALAACVVLLVAARPPAGLPVLSAAETGAGPQLAVPGGTLDLAWSTGVESAGGHYAVAGHTVTLSGVGQLDPQDVAVRQSRWSHEVFQPEHSPAPGPVVIGLRVRLPEDETLAGQRVVLRIAANLDYPGRSRPDGPVALQASNVTREWAFAVATPEELAAFARHARGRHQLAVGLVLCAVVIVAVGFAAGLLAQRHLEVQCPKCGRIAICTYYPGGGKLHMSACPHKGSRPVN